MGRDPTAERADGAAVRDCARVQERARQQSEEDRAPPLAAVQPGPARRAHALSTGELGCRQTLHSQTYILYHFRFCLRGLGSGGVTREWRVGELTQINRRVRSRAIGRSPFSLKVYQSICLFITSSERDWAQARTRNGYASSRTFEVDANGPTFALLSFLVLIWILAG